MCWGRRSPRARRCFACWPVLPLIQSVHYVFSDALTGGRPSEAAYASPMDRRRDLRDRRFHCDSADGLAGRCRSRLGCELLLAVLVVVATRRQMRAG